MGRNVAGHDGRRWRGSSKQSRRLHRLPTPIRREVVTLATRLGRERFAVALRALRRRCRRPDLRPGGCRGHVGCRTSGASTRRPAWQSRSGGPRAGDDATPGRSRASPHTHFRQSHCERDGWSRVGAGGPQPHISAAKYSAPAGTRASLAVGGMFRSRVSVARPMAPARDSPTVPRRRDTAAIFALVWAAGLARGLWLLLVAGARPWLSLSEALIQLRSREHRRRLQCRSTTCD